MRWHSCLSKMSGRAKWHLYSYAYGWYQDWSWWRRKWIVRMIKHNLVFWYVHKGQQSFRNMVLMMFTDKKWRAVHTLQLWHHQPQFGQACKMCQRVSPNRTNGGLTGTNVCHLYQPSAAVSLHAHRRARQHLPSTREVLSLIIMFIIIITRIF